MTQWYEVKADARDTGNVGRWSVLVVDGYVAAASAPFARVGDEWTTLLERWNKWEWQVRNLVPRTGDAG